MAIYTCFIQQVINSLKKCSGKGAIVIPTGFITAKSGIENKILKHIVDNKIVYGCVSMPSNGLKKVRLRDEEIDKLSTLFKTRKLWMISLLL